MSKQGITINTSKGKEFIPQEDYQSIIDFIEQSLFVEFCQGDDPTLFIATYYDDAVSHYEEIKNEYLSYCWEKI